MHPEYRIDTFIGPGCQGNRQEVFLCNADFDKSDFLNYSESETKDIVVVISGFDKADILSKPISLNFFQQGREIKRCGSGTLAAAHVVFSASQSVQQIKVGTAAGEVLLKREQGKIGYATGKLEFSPVKHAGLWETIVSKPVKNIVAVGGEDDYTIVELYRADDIKYLKPKLRTLSTQSKRALIVTAKSGTKKCDYVMRYFAPQYSSKEDAATGSANSILIDYWSQQEFDGWVKGEQLSREGGLFQGRVTNSLVYLFGRTKLVEA